MVILSTLDWMSGWTETRHITEEMKGSIAVKQAFFEKHHRKPIYNSSPVLRKGKKKIWPQCSTVQRIAKMTYHRKRLIGWEALLPSKSWLVDRIFANNSVWLSFSYRHQTSPSCWLAKRWYPKIWLADSRSLGWLQQIDFPPKTWHSADINYILIGWPSADVPFILIG